MRYKKIILPLLILISLFTLFLSLTDRRNQTPPTKSTISEDMGAKPDIKPDENINDTNNTDRSHSDGKLVKEPLGDKHDAQPEKVIIEGSPVIATIIHNTKLYNTVNGGVIQDVNQGQQVEILQDRSYSWYEVSFDDIVGWVKAEALDIPPDPPTNPTRYSKEQLEDFINEQHFESKTPHLIWVDIDRQLVYIFKGSLDKWRLHKTMICSTGKNVSPTTRGLFRVSDRDTWMYTPRLGSGAKNWLRFNDTYLFHSVAFAKDGKTITDDVLGVRASAGCVRLSLEDSQWLYDNIESDTTVWVN